FGHPLVEVLEDGEGDLPLLRVGRDADERVLGAGVDGEDLHVLGGVLPVQLGERGDVEVGDRALGVEEDDDERLLVLEPAERARPAVDVLEAEVRDRRAGRGGRDLRLGRCGKADRGGDEERERRKHHTSLLRAATWWGSGRDVWRGGKSSPEIRSLTYGSP